MKTPTRFSFELADDAAARVRAQEIADKTGREVVVIDEDGHEVCRVSPVRQKGLMVPLKN